MPIAVLYALQIAPRVMVSEGDLAALAPERLPSDYLQGQLTIVAPGQPVVHIEDDLEFVFAQCLTAIPELLAGRSFAFVFSDAPGGFLFAPHGDLVRVTGDILGNEPFDAPAGELLVALRDCAARFIAFTTSALADRPADQQRVKELEPALADATKALGAL